MTGNLPTVLSATLLAALGVLPARAAEMGTQISYQGSLTNGGSPVNAQIDMRFTLYDAAVGGNVVGMSAVFDGQPGNGAPVDVVDGLLSATPDFGANVFDGTAIWLQVDVRNPHDPTDSAPYELLDPRQPITAAPVALQTKGIFVDENTGNVGVGTTSPNDELDVAGNVHANGTITSGNSIVVDGTPGAERIISSAALEIHTGSGRALRLEPEATSPGDRFGPNVVGGWQGNAVTAGVTAATIAGGGATSFNPMLPLRNANRVTDDFGTVSGGIGNTAGDDDADPGSAWFSTVAGGAFNTASAFGATVGGGTVNSASGSSNSTVGGGTFNVAGGQDSTVSGGGFNEASGEGATVPGGLGNVAGGDFSFAAGYHASVRNSDNGAFVWADSTGYPEVATFESTGPDQFLIRANGGVGIGTNAPGEQLTVAGMIESTSGGFKFPDGTIQTTAALGGGGGDGHSLDASDGSPVDALFVDAGGNVGIGTATPQEALDVAGNIHATGDVELFSDSGNSFPEVRISAGTSGDSFGGSLELSGDGGIPLRVRLSNSTIGGSLELFGQFSQPLFHARAQAGGGAMVTAHNAGGVQTFQIDGNSGAVTAGGVNGTAISGTSLSVRSGASQVAVLTTSTEGGALETKAVNGVTPTARFGSSDGAPGGQMRIHQADGVLTATLDGDQWSFGQPNMGAVFAIRQSNGTPTIRLDGDDVVFGNPPTKNLGGVLTVYGGDGGESVVLDGDMSNGSGGGSVSVNSVQGSPHVEIHGGNETSTEPSEQGGVLRVLRDSGLPGVEIFARIEGSHVAPDFTEGAEIRMYDETGDETITLDSDGQVGLLTGSVLDVDNVVAEYGGFSDSIDVGHVSCVSIQTGGIGIGRNNTNNALEVEGEASKTIPGLWIANSDRRIKTNVQTVADALDTLNKVRVVSYEYTDDYRADHPGIADRRYLNVIAQEFAEVFPDYVKGSGEYLPDGSEILQADPYPLVIYAAAAVQELHQQLKDMESQLAEIRAEVEQFRSMREELAALRAEMAELTARHNAGTRAKSSSLPSVALSAR